MPSQSPGPKPEVASLQSSHMYIFLTYSSHGSWYMSLGDCYTLPPEVLRIAWHAQQLQPNSNCQTKRRPLSTINIWLLKEDPCQPRQPVCSLIPNVWPSSRYKRKGINKFKCICMLEETAVMVASPGASRISILAEWRKQWSLMKQQRSYVVIPRACLGVGRAPPSCGKGCSYLISSEAAALSLPWMLPKIHCHSRYSQYLEEEKSVKLMQILWRRADPLTCSHMFRITIKMH